MNIYKKMFNKSYTFSIDYDLNDYINGNIIPLSLNKGYIQDALVNYFFRVKNTSDYVRSLQFKIQIHTYENLVFITDKIIFNLSFNAKEEKTISGNMIVPLYSKSIKININPQYDDIFKITNDKSEFNIIFEIK